MLCAVLSLSLMLVNAQLGWYSRSLEIPGSQRSTDMIHTACSKKLVRNYSTRIQIQIKIKIQINNLWNTFKSFPT